MEEAEPSRKEFHAEVYSVWGDIHPLAPNYADSRFNGVKVQSALVCSGGQRAFPAGVCGLSDLFEYLQAFGIQSGEYN